MHLYSKYRLSRRVPYYELPVIANDGSVRTFSREIYRIKGVMAKNEKTNEIKKLSQIYYQIRTVQNKHKMVVAKRKNPDDELLLVEN